MSIDLDALLRPISEQAPAGRPLRATATYDRIQDALREDLSGAQAEGVIKADASGAARLASKALTSESKDLNLAVWLTEALVRLEGLGGLRQGLDLIDALIDRFWDSLYPLPEDGDEEMRAGPLQIGRASCRERV